MLNATTYNCPLCSDSLNPSLNRHNQAIYTCHTCWKWYNELDLQQYGVVEAPLPTIAPTLWGQPKINNTKGISTQTAVKKQKWYEASPFVLPELTITS